MKGGIFMQSTHHFDSNEENNQTENDSNFSTRETERNFMPPFRPPVGGGPGPVLPPFRPPVGGGPGPVLPPFRPPVGGGPGPVRPPRPTGFGNIRFLYAATNQPPVNAFINQNMVVRSLRFSNVTPYYSVPSGTTRIAITSSQSPNRTLASIDLFLSNGENYTIAIINSNNGLQLYAISDAPCRMRRGMSCLRAVNLIANSGAANIFIPNIGLLFRQVDFKEITTYQQLNPGNYTVYATDFRTTTFPAGNQIQIAIINGIFRPWITANISLDRDTTYTLYLIGNVSGFPAAQILLVETDLD